ncbi:hypothetical protein OPT61_g4510 [Boeremia exigua]|uniref:Uncharacterized protein n=1 Tax=Boeremia exigua TaxID=749465 RepID=A0ACC2IDS8_9PLEO|nr:hypothetical protein OPT61_g4510 [Boeremia exigua]
MTRKSSRRNPEPLQDPPRTRAEDIHTRRQAPVPASIEAAKIIPADLKAGIIANWNLSADTVNSCVTSERWPLNEPDPEKWHIDIIKFLHEASEHSKGDNNLFRLELSAEIALRQAKNRSAKGKTDCLTVTDLKKVCTRLRSEARGDKKTDSEEQKPVETRLVRRGRSNGKPQEIQPKKPQAAQEIQHARDTKPTTRQGRRKPKSPEPKSPDQNGQPGIEPAAKRHSSDLPIRPARRARAAKSPKAKPTIPPPVTPANPPEASDEEEEEEDQENAPPEPVSGRHIYGTYIPPATVDFHAESAAAMPPARQTRKRARADEQPPTQIQIDSDPRDIDATGFLSELDPKEARRRRKPRLSRLQQDVVGEPAWSQDLCEVSVTPGFVESDGVGSPELVGRELVDGVRGDGEVGLGVEVLLQILPGIPDWATSEERSLLEGRLALLQRDVLAYEECVREIMGRVEREI